MRVSPRPDGGAFFTHEVLPTWLPQQGPHGATTVDMPLWKGRGASALENELQTTTNTESQRNCFQGRAHHLVIKYLVTSTENKHREHYMDQAGCVYIFKSVYRY